MRGGCKRKTRENRAIERKIKMIISGSEMEFSKFEKVVYGEIQKRHFDRISPPLKFAAYDPTAIPTFEPIPREITKISVSFWLHCELRRRAGEGGIDRIAVDYCDGKGPRPRWFGIVCDVDTSLSGKQVRLGPDA